VRHNVLLEPCEFVSVLPLKALLCDFGPFVMQTSCAGFFPDQTAADSRESSCRIAVCLSKQCKIKKT